VRHPFFHGRSYAAEDDLTPEEMARIGAAAQAALRDIQVAARSLGAEWALVGGQALISYGVPRITTDVDVLAVLAGDLAVELVEKHGWTPLRFSMASGDYEVAETVHVHEMDDPVLYDVRQRRVMFPVRSPSGLIADLLTAQHPVEAEMVDLALPRTVHGERVPVAPLGGVLLVKVKANRGKDIAAVEQTAEFLAIGDLESAVEWAEQRDKATAQDMESIIREVKARLRPTRIEPYQPRGTRRKT
jgi:hypothetical protein